jgi:hypothetical protein
MGKVACVDEFHAWMRFALESTTVTLMCGFFWAMTAHVGAPKQLLAARV